MITLKKIDYFLFYKVQLMSTVKTSQLVATNPLRISCKKLIIDSKFPEVSEIFLDAIQIKIETDDIFDEVTIFFTWQSEVKIPETFLEKIVKNKRIKSFLNTGPPIKINPSWDLTHLIDLEGIDYSDKIKVTSAINLRSLSFHCGDTFDTVLHNFPYLIKATANVHECTHLERVISGKMLKSFSLNNSSNKKIYPSLLFETPLLEILALNLGKMDSVSAIEFLESFADEIGKLPNLRVLYISIDTTESIKRDIPEFRVSGKMTQIKINDQRDKIRIRVG